MIQDPYRVLGIPQTATADEVKAAYRKLAKQYHPDVNHGSAEAERKMKEINEAYDMIVNHKYTPGQNASSSGYGGYSQTGYGGYSQGGYAQQQSYGGQRQERPYADPFEGFGGFGGFGNFWGSAGQQQRRTYAGEPNESSDMRAVRNYLNSGHYREALDLLGQCTVRGPRWCFYCAVANDGLGNRINALNYAQQAVRMDPNNDEYREFLEQLQYADGANQNYGRNFTMPRGNLYTVCMGLCLLNMCCGGRFCIC